MNDQRKEFVDLLWGWALLYPLVMVWGVDLLVSAALRRDMALESEWLPKLFQSAIASIPFIVLALCARALLSRGDRRAMDGLRFAAISVIAASILVWSAYYWDGIIAYTQQTSGGANIGLGLLLLFSPVILSSLIPAAYWIGTKLSKS